MNWGKIIMTIIGAIAGNAAVMALFPAGWQATLQAAFTLIIALVSLFVVPPHQDQVAGK